MLCEKIGTRWASSSGEWQAVNYIRDYLERCGLVNAALEEFPLHTWRCDEAAAYLTSDTQPVAVLPFNRCPPVDLTAPLVDVSFGTAHDIAEHSEALPGAIAILSLGYEPFTTPMPLSTRLAALAQAGAVAAIVVDRKEGGRVEYHNAGDYRSRARHPPAAHARRHPRGGRAAAPARTTRRGAVSARGQ